MKFSISVISLVLGSIHALAAQSVLSLPNSILNNSSVAFVSHANLDTLPMNIAYEPVKMLRKPIEELIGRPLKFLTAFDPSGEAHVTVITPPEYQNNLKYCISMDEIEAIARSNRIQDSDLAVFGIGSGKAMLNGVKEETFFLIVDSMNLRKIRYDIYLKCLEKGGSANGWDPSWFFPHITIGYTSRDLHESDNVIKNVKFSFDSRFKLKLN